jgi:hypothetical protein
LAADWLAHVVEAAPERLTNSSANFADDEQMIAILISNCNNAYTVCARVRPSKPIKWSAVGTAAGAKASIQALSWKQQLNWQKQP